MPRVNARSMAEMMSLPGHAQMRVLAAQKYPGQSPNVFRVPYYAPAVAAFRAAYKSDAPHDVLKAAIAKAAGERLPHRRHNLERAIGAFGKLPESDRHLKSIRVPRVNSNIGSVELKASPDIEAKDDNDRTVVIYYNCTAFKFDEDVAKRLLEIAHWIYEQNSIDLDPKQFEMLDLSTGVLHRIKKIRAATIQNMKTTARMIEQLWDSL